jgi:hypothetical protein
LKRLDEERRKKEREVISARDKRWWKDGSQFLAGSDIQGRRYRGLPPIISARRDPPRPPVDEENSQKSTITRRTRTFLP